MTASPSFCPHCGGLVPPKVANCAHCGGGLSGVLPTRAILICPRCAGATLSEDVEGDVTMHRCPQCDGQWVDRVQFHAATSKPAVYQAAQDGRVALEPYRRPPFRLEQGYVRCPRCEDLMNRRSFARGSGILIDECGHHGVWLDAGEMDQLRSFIANGGLEQHLEAEIRDARDIAVDARQTADRNVFMARLLHRWKLKRILFDGF